MSNMSAKPSENERLTLRIPQHPQRQHFLEEVSALLIYVEAGHPVAHLKGYSGRDRAHVSFEVDSEHFHAIRDEVREAALGPLKPVRWFPKRGFARGH